MGKILQGGMRLRVGQSMSYCWLYLACAFLQMLGFANYTRQDMKLWLKIEVILMPHDFVLILCTAVSVRGRITEFPSLL